MKQLSTFAILAFALSVGSACGDDSGAANDADVPVFEDSAPPDATSAPDAAPCQLTECGQECVDTSTSSAHCGGCDMACDSPGQICTGSLPCACPDPFVAATINPTGLDQVFMQGGFYLAASPTLGGTLSALLVVYGLNDETGVEVDLSRSAGTLTPPALAAAYDIDTSNFSAHTPYAAVEGTLILETRCAGGVSGTATDVKFVEVLGTTNPTIVEGGCEFTVPSIDFEIGTACPPEMMDAGVADASAADADI